MSALWWAPRTTAMFRGRLGQLAFEMTRAGSKLPLSLAVALQVKSYSLSRKVCVAFMATLGSDGCARRSTRAHRQAGIRRLASFLCVAAHRRDQVEAAIVLHRKPAGGQ